MVLPEVQNGTLETWCSFNIKCQSVELERGWISDFVADFDAHSMGVGCWGEWYTRAVHAWRTVLPDQAQKKGKDGWTKAVGEGADGQLLVRYGSDGFSGSDGYDGGDGFDGSDGVDGSVGHHVERTGVDDVLGYDYPGEMAVLLDDFVPESEFWL